MTIRHCGYGDHENGGCMVCVKNKIPEGEHQTKILSKYFYSIKTLLIFMMMVVVIMFISVMQACRYL